MLVLSKLDNNKWLWWPRLLVVVVVVVAAPSSPPPPPPTVKLFGDDEDDDNCNRLYEVCILRRVEISLSFLALFLLFSSSFTSPSLSYFDVVVVVVIVVVKSILFTVF